MVARRSRFSFAFTHHIMSYWTVRLKRRKIHAEFAKCIAAVCKVRSTHAVFSDAVSGFSGPDESLFIIIIISL